MAAAAVVGMTTTTTMVVLRQRIVRSRSLWNAAQRSGVVLVECQLVGCREVEMVEGWVDTGHPNCESGLVRCSATESDVRATENR